VIDFYATHYARVGDSIRLQNVLKYAQGSPALDVGCGDGGFSLKLGADVYGIDVSSEAVSLANERGVKARVADAGGDWPFQDAFFELVFAGEVIEHVYDTERFLQECRRVLKPGGRLILTTPNLAAWYSRVALLFGYQPFWSEVALHSNPGKLGGGGEGEPSGHIRVMTTRALKQLVASQGFAIEHVFGSAQVEVVPRLARPLERFLARFPSLAGNVGLVARRLP